MVRCAELNLRVALQGGLTGLVGAAVSDANEPEIVVLLDHAFAIEVDADEPLHVLQAQEQAAGCDYGRERMAGAGNADGDILLRGRMHERGQFVFGTRLRLVPGDEGLVANPVAPVPARPQLRRRRLRDVSHFVIPLTARQRAVLVAELNGMPHAEIAAALGMTKNALYKLAHDARKRVKLQLETAGISASEVTWVFE